MFDATPYELLRVLDGWERVPEAERILDNAYAGGYFEGIRWSGNLSFEHHTQAMKLLNNVFGNALVIAVYYLDFDMSMRGLGWGFIVRRQVK